MSYDPDEYWHERGKIYQSTFQYNENFRLQEKYLLDHLRRLSFSSVLEVGCGFGRITKLLLENFNITTYTALDLSPDQIESAKRYINHSEKVNFVLSDIQSFNPQQKFDLVIGVEVLLHIKPEDIGAVIAKLLSYTNHYFVHIDWYEEGLNHSLSDPHNFMHDYDEIYSNVGVKYTKQKIKTKKPLFRSLDTKQTLFVATTRD